MNCGKCGQPVEGDSRFCRHCGAPLEEANAAEAGAPAPPTSAAPKGATSAKGADIYRDPQFEEEVWEGRPCGRSYFGTWALWGIGSAVLLGAAWKWASAGSLTLVKVLLVIVLLVGLFILARVAHLVLGNNYRLTTQRLFVRRGLVARTTDQMELVRVDDVRVRQGLVDRLVNTGSVELISTDPSDQDLLLRCISAPNEVTELVRRHVRGVRSKGTLFVEQV